MTAALVLENAHAAQIAKVIQDQRDHEECSKKQAAVLEAAIIAIPVVLRAGLAGNVQCAAVTPAILSLLKDL